MDGPKTKHKILLTGGAGFIGSHVAEAYLQAGHAVVIVDNLSTGKREHIPSQAEFYEADICDIEEMEKIFSKERPTLINHHAAQTDVRFSVEHPAVDARQNILGGIGLLILSQKFGGQKWIFASTGGALYGEVPHGKAGENSPITPVSPYGTSKYCFEKYLELYGRLNGLNYTILRYANVYGPRQIPKAEGSVIAIFINSLLQGKSPTIFGDGKQERDFVYVQDVVQANLLALNAGAQAAVNIGSSQAVSIRQLLTTLQRELKSDQKPKWAPQRPGEIFRSVLDNLQAGKKLAWHPQTLLTEGLKKTISWQKGLDKY